MKTYYAQLKKPVLKHVKAYRDDFIVTDKKLLRNYHGSFVHKEVEAYIKILNDFDTTKEVEVEDEKKQQK